MKLQPITIDLEWIRLTDTASGSFEGVIELENDQNLLICAEILARKWGKLTGDGYNHEKQFTEEGNSIIIYTIDMYDLESGMEVEYNRSEMEKLIKQAIILN